MKKIAIICDGTSQGFWDDNNMSILAAFIKQDETQYVYYDPGVGTLGTTLQKLTSAASGWGLWHNVVEAYRYLTNTYREGDKVYLFGYSRGAATVVTLADVLKKVGLLQRGADNLLPYLQDAYINYEYSEALRHHTIPSFPITYVGLEDCVYSTWFNAPAVDASQLDVLEADHYIAQRETRRAFKLTNIISKIDSTIRETPVPETHNTIAYSDVCLSRWLFPFTLTKTGNAYLRGDTAKRIAPKQHWLWKLTPKAPRQDHYWYRTAIK